MEQCPPTDCAICKRQCTSFISVASSRAERMSDQPHQNTLHLVSAHVHILSHSTVKHARRHIPPPAFLLQVIETLEDNTFPVGETVSDIWERVTRVTGRHRSMLFALVSLMDSTLLFHLLPWLWLQQLWLFL